MDKGNCFGCKKPIIWPHRFAKTADDLYFHETCFKCTACGDSLVNTLYYTGPDASGYYCKDDYLLRWGIECKVCHLFIEGKPLRDSKGNNYHDACLHCCECRASLTNDCYKFEGSFYCKRHYYEKCGKKCKSCRSYIYDSDLVTVTVMEGGGDGAHFHQRCFACLWCQKPFDPLAKYFGTFATEMLCRSCQILKNESLQIQQNTSGHEFEQLPVTTTGPAPASNNNKEEPAPIQNEEKQEIMVMETMEEKHTKNGAECTICFDSHVDSVFIPCGHMCLCYGCATTYLESKVDERDKVCPICRAVCAGVFRTYPS